MFRLIFSGLVGLSVDEAYYWHWSTRPALGYYDHPPLVAWLIAAGTWLLGPTELGVRSFFVVTGALGNWALFVAGRRLFNPVVGYRALWLLCMTPLFGAGLTVVAIPETLLVALWAGSLASGARLIARPEPKAFDWLLWGTFFGLGLLAKVTASLMLVPLGVTLTMGTLRSRLKRIWPWLSLAWALVLWSPFLAWNANHQWATFGMMSGRLLSAAVKVNHVTFMQPMLAHVGLLLPGAWLCLWGAMWCAFFLGRRNAKPSLIFVALSALSPLLLFAGISWFRMVLPHWSAIGFISASLAVAYLWPLWTRRFGGMGRWVAGLSLSLSWVIMTGAVLLFAGLKPFGDWALSELERRGNDTSQTVGKSPLGDLVGSEQAAEAVDLLMTTHLPDRPGAMILSHHWAVAARLTWGFRGRREVYAVGARSLHYRLWQPVSQTLGRDALLVADDAFRVNFDEAFQCERHLDVDPITTHWGQHGLRVWHVRVCHNLLGVAE